MDSNRAHNTAMLRRHVALNYLAEAKGAFPSYSKFFHSRDTYREEWAKDRHSANSPTILKLVKYNNTLIPSLRNILSILQEQKTIQ
jgi:hypothetical protein